MRKWRNRQTHYLEGVASMTRAGSSPAFRTNEIEFIRIIFFILQQLKILLIIFKLEIIPLFLTLIYIYIINIMIQYTYIGYKEVY